MSVDFLTLGSSTAGHYQYNHILLATLTDVNIAFAFPNINIHTLS